MPNNLKDAFTLDPVGFKNPDGTYSIEFNNGSLKYYIQIKRDEHLLDFVRGCLLLEVSGKDEISIDDNGEEMKLYTVNIREKGEIVGNHTLKWALIALEWHNRLDKK